MTQCVQQQPMPQQQKLPRSDRIEVSLNGFSWTLMSRFTHTYLRKVIFNVYVFPKLTKKENIFMIAFIVEILQIIKLSQCTVQLQKNSPAWARELVTRKQLFFTPIIYWYSENHNLISDLIIDNNKPTLLCCCTEVDFFCFTCARNGTNVSWSFVDHFNGK